MKSDHARTVKSLLKDARISSSANQDSLSTSMMPPTSTSMEAHDQPMSSSPFASLGNIENAGLVTNYTLQGPTGRLKIQEFKGSAKISKVPITICKFEEALIPCYTSFTTLQDNLLIDDDEYLRYWPYFGDQDGDYDNNRVNHHFKNQVRDLPALHHEAEQAARHRPYIERILIETGCDPVDVLHYMTLESSSDIWRESAQLSSALERRQSKMHPRQTPPKELAKVTNHLGLPHPSKLLLGATVYLEFTERTQPSVWPGFCRELLRIQGAKVERTMHNIGLPSATRQLSSKLHALSLETYTTLGCLVCHRHECPGHGEFYLKNEEDHIRRRVVGPTEEEMASVPLPARMDQETEHCTAVQPCSRQCCRHTNDALQQDPFGPTQTVWTKADAALVEKLSSAYLDYREACCVMSFLIRKPCIEIHRKVYAMRKHDPSNGIELFAAKKRLSMPRIDMLETKTANLDEREPFTPCHHAGPCTTLCSCYQNDVACEKSCLCAWDCSRRFRGCNCAVAGRLCQTRKCTCVNFNRECDPDVCGPCGAAEILEPGRLAQGDQALPLERQCCNVNVQLGRPKRTILGTSEVAGYGLFMGEPAQKGDYLGQYLGEVISTDEANRRGSIYDQRQLSYLFDLNKDQVVDASRAGNKFRFINNSELAFNCRPKVLLVNGVHHIAMFADKDLVPGEELFFNYGYGRENRKFVSIEPGSRKGGKAPLTIPPRIVEEDGSDPEHRPRGKARVVKKKKLKPFKEKGIGVKGHRRGKQIIKGTRNVPPNDLGLGTDSAEVLSRESIPSPAVERNDEDVAQWFLDQAAKFHRGLPSDFNTSTHAERPDPSRFPSINGEPHEHPLPASSQVSQLRATPPRAPDEDQVMLDLDADPLPEEDEPDSEDVYDPTKEAAPDEDEDFEDEADVEEVERGRRRKGRGGGVRVVQGRGKKAPKARVVTGRGRGWRRGVARKSTFH
ncbi:MAG: hypothetical protein M1817_000078 [Caeruleum heppii]|nr:MAG: hypothetical protein M1817_000078 [Caeruleum heppii]